MKLIDHFTSFLHDTVNLNATRLGHLETSVDTLKEVLESSDWGPEIITFEEQGSWAHKTIIKPVDGKVFDADLLAIIKPVEGWEAKKYLSQLRKVFADHGTYKDKVRRYSHCVTIEYAGERRVDIVPCIRDRNGYVGHEVCNHNDDAFERSEPEAYTVWLNDRNEWTRGGLKKVTRLLKYLRDIKGNFSCPSVLLTTLLGMQITLVDSLSTGPFSDVPAALKTIVDRLDDWLQAHPKKPLVCNPVLSTEWFSDMWTTDEQYENFRDKVNLYRGWIDDAFAETDRDESIGKWRRVFGDEFAAGVILDKSASALESARLLARAFAQDTRNLVAHAQDDLVGLVRRYGLRVLPVEFDKLVYKRQPTWRRTRHGGFNVTASATLHASRGAPRLRAIVPGEEPLPKDHYLRFEVREAGGSMFPPDKFRVQWRITNTDREALAANCLRGGFEDADDGTARWEYLRFRGVHIAEAFVVRRNDRMLVGQSPPFYVVIE